jgi:hypothetical protein
MGMETYRATTDVIACTLTPDDLKETQQAWQKLFRLSLVSREEVPGGLRLAFHPRSAEALRSLVDVERDCCRWITFELDGPVVTMTSPGAGEAALREMWSVS